MLPRARVNDMSIVTFDVIQLLRANKTRSNLSIYRHTTIPLINRNAIMGDKAAINRSLNNVRTELEYLRDSGVLVPPQFQSIMAQLPVSSCTLRNHLLSVV